MKIDFSTIFLVVFLVLPGLFSRRSQNSVAPRSLEEQGATEELAEFVVQGLSVHLILAILAAALIALFGVVRTGHISTYFKSLDSTDIDIWAHAHVSESILLFAAYVPLTFLVGNVVGLLGGLWRLHRPFSSFVLKRSKRLQRWGLTGSLGERPIIYEVLSPEIAADGTPSIVFIEAEMKDSLGFYSGQVSQYAVEKDSEPHKPIFLTEVWFRLLRSDSYEQVDAEGVFLDLADVATLRVDQVASNDLVEEAE